MNLPLLVSAYSLFLKITLYIIIIPPPPPVDLINFFI